MRRQTRDLTACSIVPQSTILKLVQFLSTNTNKNLSKCIIVQINYLTLHEGLARIPKISFLLIRF
jgi:hypothetical protein